MLRRWMGFVGKACDPNLFVTSDDNNQVHEVMGATAH